MSDWALQECKWIIDYNYFYNYKYIYTHTVSRSLSLSESLVFILCSLSWDNVRGEINKLHNRRSHCEFPAFLQIVVTHCEEQSHVRVSSFESLHPPFSYFETNHINSLSTGREERKHVIIIMRMIIIFHSKPSIISISCLDSFSFPITYSKPHLSLSLSLAESSISFNFALMHTQPTRSLSLCVTVITTSSILSNRMNK